MTVWYEQGRGYRFDFRLFHQRHTSPRGFETEQEAKDAEYELRRSLRRQAAGLEPTSRAESWSFTVAAGLYYKFIVDRQRIDDTDTVDRVQRVILRFFGVQPAKDAVDGEPYHDLCLQDVIDHPSWLLKFEDWMTARKIAGSTKNRYRSAASRLYWFAMLPQNREASGITSNPFRGILRDQERGRDVTLSAAQIRSLLQYSPQHLRLAIVIAALAPKLRLGNILALRWDTHLDRDLTAIRVQDHKTKRKTKRALVAPISDQLRVILDAARKLQPKKVPWVIHYHREQLGQVKDAVRDACKSAGIPYGRKDGATFHTIRHSAATLLAELGIADGLRKDVMGHLSFKTTHGYTHLKPIHERAPLELLSAALPLQDVLAQPRLPAPKSHRKVHRKARKPVQKWRASNA